MKFFMGEINLMDQNNKRKQSFRNTLETTKYMLGLVWKDGKLYLFIKIILSIINTIFPLVNTIFPGLIINELTNGLRIKRIIFYIGVLTLSPLIKKVLNSKINTVLTNLSSSFNVKCQSNFLLHMMKMDYATLENPEIDRLKYRANDVLDNALNTVNLLSTFITAVLSLIGISYIITTLSPFIVVFIICVVYVNSLVTKWLNKQQYISKLKQEKNSTKKMVLSYIVSEFWFAKEIRLFGLKDFLVNKYVDIEQDTNKEHLSYLKKENRASFAMSVTAFIQQSVVYAYLIFLVIKRNLPIGNMTIYMSAVGYVSSELSSAVNAYLRLSANSLNVNDLIDFMNIPLTQYTSGSKIPQYSENSIIEFRNVSFKYPGSENYALKNLNLRINHNEKLCIVGNNGSGKTTFIKLLTRLYSPTEGEILLNGINIFEYDFEKYLRLFAPVFQDFCRYDFTLEENIVMADAFNAEKLDRVCIDNNLMKLVKKLPNGYKNYVGKTIDGTGFEPSGGEDQRIAIARACYHGGEIFILDEPTAALDPNAEYEIYTQFSKMITDKCAVLITHRLSAVQLADKVAVFDNGSVVEYGTHKELYEKGGIYTEMFDKQAQFYRDEIVSKD